MRTALSMCVTGSGFGAAPGPLAGSGEFGVQGEAEPTKALTERRVGFRCIGPRARIRTERRRSLLKPCVGDAFSLHSEFAAAGQRSRPARSRSVRTSTNVSPYLLFPRSQLESQ